jgi:hypothetical protein
LFIERYWLFSLVEPISIDVKLSLLPSINSNTHYRNWSTAKINLFSWPPTAWNIIRKKHHTDHVNQMLSFV